MNTKILYLFLVVALMLTLTGPTITPSQAAPADATFTVTTNLDYSPGAPDGSCYNSVVEGCGLREAIVEANAAAGNKSINFSTALAGLTIYLNSPDAGLGGLSISGDNIVIDGSTSGGDIIIDAGGLSANNNLFEIQGNNNTIRHLMLRGWPDTRNPDPNYGHGVRIYDSSANGMASYNTLDYLRIFGFEHNGVLISGDLGGGGHHNTVAHSVIGGANWSQTTCPGDGNRWEGIAIANGADNTNINANQIVCNGNSGVWLNGGTGGQISETIIQTNKIGTDGAHDMGNGLSGIVDTQAISTTIYNNQISGNNEWGVWLQSSSAAVLTGNRIGLDITGNVALPNSFDGVLVSDGAAYNHIGTDVGRNWISGNTYCGVRLDTGAHDNVLENNYIGTNMAGTAAVPNSAAGVAVSDSSSTNNFIGTSQAGVYQIISGNTREGIYIEDAGGTFIGQATYIGVASDRLAALGNGLQGVMLNNATDTSVFATVIAYNGGAGVAVVGNSATGNSIRPQGIIRSNGGLPVDLGNDGPTPNDPGDSDSGPNGLLNYPVITGGSGSAVSGTACNNCTVFIYRAIGNPAAVGGGGEYAQEVTADASGNWNATLSSGLTPANITMMACESPCFFTGSTSEMSPVTVYEVFLPLVLK